MNKTATPLFFALVVAGLAGCDSPAPETSSSSNWITCKTLDDCGAAASAVACTGGYCVDRSGARLEAQAEGPGPCDPLAGPDLPVTLGTVLGVGEGPGGTLYVADEVTSPTTTDRVFVSEGSVLVRKRVTGTGSNGGVNDGDFTFTFENAGSPAALIIKRRGGAVVGIGLGAPGKSFFDDPGAVTTPLTAVGEDALTGKSFRNLPGDKVIEYVADVESGELVVVTRPAEDWTYDDFRLYYGPATGLAERKVLNVSRARDGGSTTIQFTVGAKQVEATFPWHLGALDDGGVSSGPLPGTLDVGPATATLTQRFPVPATLDGLSFTCL